MKAYKSVLKCALADGYIIAIDQGEGEIIKCGGSYKQAVEAIEAVGESWILVVQTRPQPKEWVRVAALYVIWGGGMADDETIADWYCDKDPAVKNWADRWSEAYYADSSFAGPLDH